MNINRKTSRGFWNLAAAAAATLLWSSTAMATPDPITDLTVVPGPSTGTILLNWTARTADGISQRATSYQIKYRFNNKITNDTDWTNGYRIEEPPVNLAAPIPGVPGTVESLLVTGLEPGTIYGFMVRAADTAGNLGPTGGSSSEKTTATAPCPQDPNDGLGVSGSSLIPTTLPAGNVQTATMTIAINGAGIATGGKIALRVPDFFPWPVLTNANQTGYITYSVTPGGPGLSMSVDGQSAVLTVTTGTISSGSTVTFFYKAQACQIGIRRFRIATQYSSCGVLTDTGVFNDIAVMPGASHFIDFQNFDIAALTGQITPVDFRVTDFCGNSVPMTAGATVPVSAVFFNGNSFVPEPVAIASLSLQSVPFDGLNAVPLYLATGAISGRVYYKITDTSNKPNDRIQILQTDLQNPQGNWIRLVNVRPLLSGIANTSVDTGVVVPGQKTVIFTPDSDGVNDTVAVNFSIPERAPWMVEISSDGFASITRRFFGDTQDARVIWDGFTDGQPGNPPSIAPSGIYSVRISLGGNAIVDTSLSFSLSAAGVQGLVRDAALNPLPDVDIQIFGPTNRYARTNLLGLFSSNGLKGGTYQVRYQKTGYSTVEVTATLTGGMQLLPTATLTKESVLRLVIRRPQSDRMDEVWGQVRGNNADWSKQAWGTVHFARGKDLADAGDLYNVTPTSSTALTLTPNVQYRIHFDVPNLSTGDMFQTLAVSTDIFYPILLQPRANIEGKVQLAAGTNPSGTWISVEAGPDANGDGVYDNQDPSKRFWGGAYLAANETSGIYRIFGVDNGTYAVVASAPNFIPQRSGVVISNDQDGNLDFPPLSVGGTITGSVSIPGDSTALDALDGTVDGFFSVPINVWASSLQTGSFQQVRVATSTLGALQLFTLTGLQDGLYEVYASLPGYELNPPGRRTVTVTGGTGTLSLSFQPFSGGLSGQITLPGTNSDYNNTQITVRAYDWNLGTFTNPTISGGTYTFQHLGTGFYLIHATYLTTGFTVDKNVQIVNGLTATANLDLSGQTFSISGRVTTSARSPYNTIDYLVNGSTPTTMYDTTGKSNHVLPANRIIVERIQQNNSGIPIDTDPSHYDASTYVYGVYDTTGNFSISNLTPGSYRIHNNDEINNTFSDGAELSQTTRIVKILTANATGQDLDISDGFTVSGSISVTDGSTPNRNVHLELKNAGGAVITSKDVYMAASAGTFSLDRIPSGDYILSTTDMSYPKAYAAKDVRVVVDGASVTSVQIDLLKAARLRGKLRIKTSGVLLTSRNFDQFLSADFYIEARANPWFNGGYARAIDPLIDADGNFALYSNPGKFDLYFKSNVNLSPQDVSQGKKQFVPLQISGIEVQAGQTYDLGVVELIEGTVISGTVRNKSGQPVANVLVVGRPSGDNGHNSDPLQAVTNELGQYTLQGVDSTGKRFYDVIAAPRAQDGRFSGYTGTIYGEIRRTQVDTRLATPIDFVVEPALGIVRGRLVTPDGGDLETPFDHDQQPGGDIIMNRVGTIPSDNPLGNIEQTTQSDGTFEIRGLVPGTYSLWGLGKGYANGLVKNIPVGNGATDVGTITLQAGFKLSGQLKKPDGSAPSSSDVDTLVAVRGGFEELLIGTLTKDAAGTIIGYEISGFQAGKSYTVLMFDSENDILVLGDGVIVNGDTKRDFTLVDRQPSVLAQASKAQDGSVVIQFEFTRALRNSPTDLDGINGPDDSEGPKIISLKSGNGLLTHPTDWLSFDRKRARVVYAPTADDSRFTLTVSAAFETIDPATGLNHTVLKDFPFFLGIGKQKEQKFTNAGGGVVQLDEDTSEFSAQSGTFGANADDTVNVIFRAADNISSFSGSSAAPQISRAMATAAKLGLKSYPPEMGSAINRARLASVNPFGSFYDIFLPAGVSHFFPQGKEANLCVAYDANVADPYSLNVYYFNEATNEYLLENENKTVDTDNTRICVSLGHASVFTVLNSSAAVIGGAGYNGPLNVMNFPNPFNLKAKAITLQDPGSASASQTINGTMIKVSVPPEISGALEIEVFSVSGEKVRTIHDNIPVGGAHYYVPWDGTNDSGAKLASGTYVARMTIGGANEKFFKMAVIK